MRPFHSLQPHVQTVVRKRIAELGEQPNADLHNTIEIALTECVPEYKNLTVEDDEFHELISALYAEYTKGEGE